MHFAMHAFSSHVEVLNKITPIDLLAQSAVLFSLTGWLQRGAVEKVFHRVVGADLYVRPNTCRVSINKIVRHPIYGNQNQMAQAVGVVQNGT